jgi:hypothetical protein
METDYLVIGAGLAGMAFTDALLAETDARVTIVDRRHAPGGHWNDAYPFVRLHQPSAFYGVASGNLGEDRIDATGPNAGFYERATGAEVCHHFQEVMDETFVGSGRVEFVAMHDADDHGDGTATVRSRVTGASRDVTVRKKVVDARFLESSVPATHTPGFTVDDGARCIPVNGIVRDGGTADGYVILGAGKTAMDACVWLLEQGVDPDEITWVKPREPWVTDRGAIQPRDKVGDFIKGYAASVEASAHATSIRDLFERLEAGGSLHRIDAGVDPTMFRGSLLSEHERTQLRSIENVVRAGRVRRIQRSVMQMDGGPVTVTPGALFVDCTAVGLRTPPPRPIFEATRITIQNIREGSPSFSAALIGYLEATRGDDVCAANELAPPNPYPDTAEDWIRERHISMGAQARWEQIPDIAAWMEGCRLNIISGLLDHAAEPGVGEALGTYLAQAEAAIENLARLRGGSVPPA